MTTATRTSFQRPTAVAALLVLLLAPCGAGGAEPSSEAESVQGAADERGPGPGAPQPYGPDPSVETRVLVPEAYELANIAIAVSDYGRESPWAVDKESDYYRRVMEHFDPWTGHELIATIDPLLAESFRNYYGFRENAFSYRLEEGGALVHAGVHSNVWNPDLFSRHLPLVEDFARAGGFRDFYAAERATYEERIERYREFVDLGRMAGWLHARFPDRRMDAYTVVFSPLILGSHSTRNFRDGDLREAVMFISGPTPVPPDRTEEVHTALHERVVFTEIDHNYVNPVSSDFAAEVNRVFADVDAWNTGDNYGSAMLTFNEYMTWAVFTLYIADTYGEETFRAVNRRVERQMAESRSFVRYPQFNRALLRLYRELEPDTIRELYPPILEWAEHEFALN